MLLAIFPPILQKEAKHSSKTADGQADYPASHPSIQHSFRKLFCKIPFSTLISQATDNQLPKLHRTDNGPLCTAKHQFFHKMFNLTKFLCTDHTCEPLHWKSMTEVWTSPIYFKFHFLNYQRMKHVKTLSSTI
jgi:hypothetical protein